MPARRPTHLTERKGIGESILHHAFPPPPPAYMGSPIAFGELVHQPEIWRRAHHIEVMEKAILRALDPEINPQGGRLIISVSVRMGKSVFGSRILPAWYLGTHPDKRVMLVGHEADFASRHGRAARDILTAYGHLFGVNVSSNSQAANRWDLEGRQGGMLTLGIGGSPIGRGGDLVIVDDPYRNYADAMSPRVRSEVIEFVAGTLFSRVHTGGTIIVIMARWHCLLPGSLVTNADGDVVPIEDLDDEEHIATSDGWSKPLAAANRQVSEEAISIRIAGLPHPLRVTADHRVLTSLGWVEAGEILPGDRVVMRPTPTAPWTPPTYIPPPRAKRLPTGARLPAGVPAWHIAMLRDFGATDADIGRRYGRSRQWAQNLRHELWGTPEERNIPDGAFDDPEVWWAVGRWLADGSLTAPRSPGSKSVAVWTIGWNKATDTERIRKAFERHGLTVSVKPNKNRGAGFATDRNVSSFTVRLSSKRFSLAMEQFGEGAWNKRVPAGIEALPEHLVRAFIRGAYSGDGCKWKGNWNRYSSRSLACVMGLRRCLAAVGIAPTVMRSGGAYEIRYHDTEWEGGHLSMKRVFNVDGALHHRVSKIERFHYEGPVYDLTTKAGDFEADGITVHNCEDLVGHLLAQDNQEWDVVNMPALCVDPITDPLGRSEGESIWPELWPVETLLQRRKEVSIKDGEAVWDAQYQQDPQASEGDMFDPDRWQDWDGPLRPPGATRWVRAWDLAATKGGGDWTVGALMCELPGEDGWLISDMVRGRWDSREVRRKMADCARTDPPNTIVRFPQDPAQAGKDQAQQITRMLQGYRVRAKPVVIDKTVNAQGFSSQQLGRNIWLPTGAQHAVWKGALIAEANAFPYGTHDDTIDACSDAFNVLAGNRARLLA